MGNCDEAEHAFHRVIELEPDNSYGYDNIGAVYITEGKWSQSIPMFQRALQIRPHFEAYSNLGTAYFYLKRYAEAAKMFGKAAELSPNQQVVLGNLADAYRWSGQTQKAIAAVSQYRFKPATVDNQPTWSAVSIAIKIQKQ